MQIAADFDREDRRPLDRVDSLSHRDHGDLPKLRADAKLRMARLKINPRSHKHLFMFDGKLEKDAELFEKRQAEITSTH